MARNRGQTRHHASPLIQQVIYNKVYSNKANVNILTSLLVAHGIKDCVVCPGSRNAPIVHNLNECPDIRCHAVTDERSAGFYALGISQATSQRVAVCVTSGTALLNLAPAVAEAYYQQRGIIVISADRPPQWIGQLDGQTLPQKGALGCFVWKSVSLPEPRNDEERWYCNRLVNEALTEWHGPVHINVPITEPLFDFSVESLPQERKIALTPAEMPPHVLSHVCRMFMQSRRPMLISGQPWNPHMDEAALLADDSYRPDFVVYTGGSIVSKRLKHFLRQAKETWVVNQTGEVTDTFQNVTQVLVGDGEVVADQIRFLTEQQPHPFTLHWQRLLTNIANFADSHEPIYSQMAAVKWFERRLVPLMAEQAPISVHYANSTAIRLANIYSRHVVHCNRGVNGIEGSLSTAAGYSCATDERVFCIIGDLSFFYDENALWHHGLRGNLRILLLNNARGGIFNLLPGLEESAARDSLIAAEHHTTAEGICLQNNILYSKAEDLTQMQQGIDNLLYADDTERPMLLEVFTQAGNDENAYHRYYHLLKAEAGKWKLKEDEK